MPEATRSNLQDDLKTRVQCLQTKVCVTDGRMCGVCEFAHPEKGSYLSHFQHFKTEGRVRTAAVPTTLLKASEGTKFDSAKPRLDLLPPEALLGAAQVLTFGAAKYADRNWEKGMNWGRAYGALLRHLLAWDGGEDIDPESGLAHLHHAACNIMFLQTWAARGMGVDDRPKKPKTDPVEG